MKFSEKKCLFNDALAFKAKDWNWIVSDVSPSFTALNNQDSNTKLISKCSFKPSTSHEYEVTLYFDEYPGYSIKRK